VLQALLDRSILFSFDRTGFRRHARSFIPGELETPQAGRIAVVTGASSGLGIEIARGLLERGASVILACRDTAKGERVRAGLPHAERARVMKLDVSDFASIRAFAASLEESAVDILVHNAGALVDTATFTHEGLETTVATHLVGPLLLTHALWKNLARSTDARLIHVSSGGMYAERLDLPALFEMKPGDAASKAFDGVRQYARAKRAQVIVSERLAAFARTASLPIKVSAMHPGWADTPGVRTSLPRFHWLTRAILRSPAEGADTVLFLALADRAKEANGRFYFDRAAQPTHMRPSTEERADERDALWSRLLHITGLNEGAFS
jgi:dehydrogenase/reductase SDR family protein 12